MGEPLPKQVLDTAVDPAEIVQASFDVERRGFDQRQVHAYLRAVADSLQDAQQRETEMRMRLGRAVRRAETAEQALRDAPTSDDAELNRQVGKDVTSVLDAARVAGKQRLAAAEKSSEQMMANAKTEATRMRSEAESVLDERRNEAETAAADLTAEAQADAQSIREQGRLDAEALLGQAADRVQHARDESDALVREAEEARAQILEDMERRRRQARAQVERLRVGRDRLLRSYEVVRRTLEETTVELKSSLQEAKVRGDSAARAISVEPLSSRQELETELADAKLIGRIKVSDPQPGAVGSDPGARVLRSPALPRRLDSPQPAKAKSADQEPPARRPRVSEAMKKGATTLGPKAPAVAPTLNPTPADAVSEQALDPIAAMIDAAEAKRPDAAAPASADLDDKLSDEELAELADDNLNVVEPSDDIEEVLALPSQDNAAAPGLFAALRAQRSKKKTNKVAEPTPAKAQPDAPNVQEAISGQAEEPSAEPIIAGDDHPTELVPGLEAQRDAVIADAAKQLEKRLKRALADEQNELLAGIRSSKKKKSVALTSIVGDVDTHVNRYIVAINEVAAVTYGAGAALLDVEAPAGHLPAGAVEELLAVDVVLPIRERLASLDGLDVATVDVHMDPVRAFYRQRKTDHLSFAASRLASLLCVAGVCDALPEESALPWAVTSN